MCVVDKDNRRKIFGQKVTVTAWKVSKYGVFSGPYFSAFELNMDQKNSFFKECVVYLHVMLFKMYEKDTVATNLKLP